MYIIKTATDIKKQKKSDKIKMSDDEHSESQFYYPDESEFQEENEVVGLNFAID